MKELLQGYLFNIEPFNLASLAGSPTSSCRQFFTNPRCSSGLLKAGSCGELTFLSA